MNLRRATIAKDSNAAEPPIVDVIRDAIRQRLLPPGMPLVQTAVADALGVSRIPVREALHYLASEGLVTFAEEGASVTRLTPNEIHELWTLRALIEGAMASAIASKASTSDLGELESLVEAMENAEEDEWSDLNHSFHTRLHKIAQLPHFASVAARVLTLIEPYSRVAVHRPDGRAPADREHREIIAALRAGDGEQLREILERHSIRARDMLVEFAETGSDEASGNLTLDAARAFSSRLLSRRAEPVRAAGDLT